MTARPDLDGPSGEPRSFDLRDYWLIIRRHVTLVVVVTVLGAIAGAGYAEHSGHSFTATAQVLVIPSTQGPSGTSAQQSFTQANMTTEQTVAQSSPVVLKAAKLLHERASTLQAAVAKHLTVTVPATTLTTSNLLQISWQAKSPSAAQAGANAFANAYLSYRRQLLASQLNSQTGSLRQALTAVQAQFTKVHSQLNRTPTTSPAHQSLALKLNELGSVEAADNSQLASLSTYNDTGGSLIAAARPVAPTGLSHKVFVVVGGLLGLLIGLILAFVRDVFDDRIRDVPQFEQKLGAPTLGVLPPGGIVPYDAQDSAIGAGKRQPSMIVTVASPDSEAAEAVRSLRAVLAAMATRRQLRTLLVVAADSSVSAGQLAAELGVALAESGRKVLLFAADLRGSTLPQIFDVPNTAGLSDLLVGDADQEGMTRKPRQVAGVALSAQTAQQLRVLPRGPQLAHAHAALDSTVMQRLLNDARQAYDFVLLDSPPASVAADAYALAANVDGVIVAARERHTRGRAVEELSGRLEQIGALVVGGVFIGRGGTGRYPQRPRGAARPHAVELTRSGPAAAPAPDARPSLPAPDRAGRGADVSLSKRTNGM
jgi:Mrp family chromosome partitioning ATPase/capsular polysaccharide biosynthesis protein